MNHDIMTPEGFTKRLIESGILADPDRVYTIEVTPSRFYNQVTAKVEYILDERFFEVPK